MVAVSSRDLEIDCLGYRLRAQGQGWWRGQTSNAIPLAYAHRDGLDWAGRGRLTSLSRSVWSLSILRLLQDAIMLADSLSFLRADEGDVNIFIVHRPST